MKIEYKIEDKTPYLYIKYEDGEWERLSKHLVDLGLEEHETTKGLGRGLTYKFYRDTEGLFRESLSKLIVQYSEKGISIIDDINSSAVVDSQFINIAVLRIVPDEDGLVKVPLSSHLMITALNNFIDVLVAIDKQVLEIAKPVKISVRFVDGNS
ncbi:MAG: hypothetical protein QXU98_05120 [Candidatus Parvarchaeota archaeon]